MAGASSGSHSTVLTACVVVCSITTWCGCVVLVFSDGGDRVSVFVSFTLVVGISPVASSAMLGHSGLHILHDVWFLHVAHACMDASLFGEMSAHKPTSRLA